MLRRQFRQIGGQRLGFLEVAAQRQIGETAQTEGERTLRVGLGPQPDQGGEGRAELLVRERVKCGQGQQHGGCGRKLRQGLCDPGVEGQDQVGAHPRQVDRCGRRVAGNLDVDRGERRSGAQQCQSKQRRQGQGSHVHGGSPRIRVWVPDAVDDISG